MSVKLTVWLTIDIPEEVSDPEEEYGTYENVQFVQLLDGNRVKLLFNEVELAYEFCEDYNFDEDGIDVDTE